MLLKCFAVLNLLLKIASTRALNDSKILSTDSDTHRIKKEKKKGTKKEQLYTFDDNRKNPKIHQPGSLQFHQPPEKRTFLEQYIQLNNRHWSFFHISPKNQKTQKKKKKNASKKILNYSFLTLT